MTAPISAEEEDRLRMAIRFAIAHYEEVIFWTSVDGRVGPFKIVEYSSEIAAIVLPNGWEEDDAVEAFVGAILRQESKLLSGELLD